MKRFNCQRVVGALIGVLALLGLTTTAAAQTTLARGDVAVVGFNSDSSGGGPSDSVTIVTLVDLAAGTTIMISDNGYLSSTMLFGTGEGTFMYIAAAAVPAGSVFTVDVSGLSTSGDQIFLFQGTLTTGTLLFGLNDSGAGVWQADSTSTNTSALPPALVGHEIALPEFDNYGYSGPTMGTKAELYAAIRMASNWTGSNDDTAFPTRPTMFTITTGAMDGGVSASDAGPPAVDAGSPAVDAGPPDVDAGPSAVDAGPPAIDAGPPAVDAGSPDIDAGTPDIDAGTPDVDAGTADEDMGVTEDMGTTPVVDAGPRDLGTPAADLGARDLGTTTPPSTRDDDGCSCSTPGTAGSTSGAAWALLALAALIPLARRRRR